MSAELGPRVTAALLAKLEEAGLARLENSEVRVLGPADSIDPDARSLAGQFETLRTQDGRRLDAIGEYARARVCRSASLRAYFGEETAEPCGLCDVCCQRKPRPPGFFAPLGRPAGKPQRPRRRRARPKRTRTRRSTPKR